MQDHAHRDAALPRQDKLNRLQRDPSSTFNDFAVLLEAADEIADERTRLLVLEVIQREFPRRLAHAAPDRDLRARRVLERIVTQIGTRLPLGQNRVPNKVLRGLRMDADQNRFFVEAVYFYRNADGYSVHGTIEQETLSLPYNFRMMTMSPAVTQPCMDIVEPIRQPEDLLIDPHRGRVGAFEHLLGCLVRRQYTNYF